MGQFTIKLFPTQNWSDDPENKGKNLDYTGYYLIANYNQQLYGNTIMGRTRVDFDESGYGILSIPENDQIQNKELSIEIYGSSGNVVRQRFNRTSNSFYDDKDKVIEITVEPEDLIEVDETPKTYKVFGRLIELSNCRDLANLQIVFFGNNTEETPTLQNSTILGVNKTFKDGYFQVEIPIDPQFRKYYAAIEHSNIDFYPLVTFSDNDKMFIQDKQIISVSFNVEENKTEEDKNDGSTDCGCHKQNDRLPSQVEFGNSNNKYSQDLGGQCVNFTVPNRTIDEFSFYHVVRTTEPEIKSVTISNAEILKIYERLVADLIKIPPKLLLTSVPLNAVFKDVTVFKNEIQRASSSSTPNRTTRATSTTSTVLSRVPTSTIRTAIPTIKYSINDFRGLESVSFSELHEKVKNNSKLEFDSKKQKLEEEEANIIQLIERVKESLESIRLNLDSPESLGKFNDLKYQLDIIKIAIGKYIESCEIFKEFFNDELNKKLLLPSELDYLKELDKTIEQFEIFEKSINNNLQQLIQTYIVRHPGRKNVSIENEIDWDSDPTLFHNTTIAHGHLLHFKQIWKNDGYSIGRVLQSIPLMPGQQKNIAVMEWNRTNVSSRLEDQTTSEQLTNNMSRDRDVSEVMESAFSENIRASSQVKSKTSGWSVGASVGFPIGPVMVGISGGYSSSKSRASSSASQDASRNLSANSMNKLRDNINQSATSMRSQRSTVIQTVSQNESFSITTEVIANYNHCHALTMQYFEILRHIVIEQKLADVQECLFVPLPMSVFDENKILRWRNTLSGVLLQPDLQEGLNAVDRMVNKYKFVDFPEGRYADENIDYIEGEMTISFNFVRPLDKLDAEGKENFEALQTKLESNPFFKIYGLFNTVLNNYKQVAFNLQKERDAIFENEIVPKIVDGLVNCLVIENSGVTIPGIDFTLIDTYENKRISGWDALFKYANQGKFSEISSKNKPLRIKFKTTLPPGIKRSNLNSLEIRFDLNNIGLGSISEFPSENRIILHSMNAKYATQHYNGTLVSNYNIKDDIKPGTTDKASVRTPLNANEKKNPKFEDAVLTAKLISHLNEYLEYYHKQIWLNMDPNRLFSLVDGFIAPHSGGKSVASVCDNQIIGVVGNNLVLKVAPGYKLDPTYNLTEAGNLLEHYQPTTPPDPFRICFPTNGIYAEAVMGACNSCEKIDDTRYWKWEEHPIPNRPTEIQPINTDSRYVEPGNLQTKDLATPMINIQNAPEAPAPTGLSGVFDLMGKSGIFSDMSGLAGNQEIVKHALTENAKTLQNTQANAVEGMKVAKQIYDSQQANKDAQRKLDEIDKAFPPNGTPEQRAENSRLKSALFNKQIGLEDANSNGMSGEVGQAVNNLSKIDELVKSGKLSTADGEAIKSSILSGVTNKTNGVINNPAIQTKIGNSGKVEYSSPNENIKLEEIIDDADPNKKLAKFIVNFRRPQTFLRTNGDSTESKVTVAYEGHFGFDWLRDEYIHPIEMVLSDLDNNPLNAKTPLVNDIPALKAEYLKEVISPINPYEQEYYPAWLSIFPPRGIPDFSKGSRMHEQGVKLSLEIDEIDVLDKVNNIIEFKSSDPLISIIPNQISTEDIVKMGVKSTKILDSANGISRTFYEVRDIVTVKSGKGLLGNHVEVKVVAKGSDKEMEVGKLMIYKNERIPKAEIVMIRLSYDDVNVNLDVQYHDILKNQAFNQALIRAEIIDDEKFIINELDATDPDVIAFKTNFPDGTNHNGKSFLNSTVDLYNKLGKHKIDPAQSSKRTLMFITNQQSSGPGGIAEGNFISGSFVWGNAVVIFNSNLDSKSSFIHEICHSLSLPHIFSKKLSIYKFFRGYTDNYLDYTTKFDGTAAKNKIANVHARLFLFKWQWDIMRADQSLIDNY
ncbi:MAG: hypothetical protein LKG19_03285 [Saprospiraceae bacterium]|jgi:hypothetical protein|nr:hypothetical protein [Saprospiraceae bacterium]